MTTYLRVFKRAAMNEEPPETKRVEEEEPVTFRAEELVEARAKVMMQVPEFT